MEGDGSGDGRVQNVVVMRHGDRIDHAEPMWPSHAARPWDPPLTDGGLIRAWTIGKRLRDLGFPIHRVLVSPFFRCIQTAAEAVRALCTIADDDSSLLAMETSHGAIIDPSRVKVSIEYGLCEMLNSQTISPSLVPKDMGWFLDISELEAFLPAGTVDHSVEQVYQQLPTWEESVIKARSRYVDVIKALADKYPSENLLLVTHGECVGVSVSAYLKDAEIYEVEYCGYSHLERKILSKHSQALCADNFKVLTQNGQTGVSYTLYA